MLWGSPLDCRSETGCRTNNTGPGCGPVRTARCARALGTASWNSRPSKPSSTSTTACSTSPALSCRCCRCGPRRGPWCPDRTWAAPLFLIAGALHRRQVTLHFPILVAIDLLQLELVLLPLTHQLLHTVLVRGLRRELGVERLIDLALARADRLALLLEALFRRLQLAGLIVAQPQRGAHVRGPALPHLRPELSRLRSVRGRGRGDTRVTGHLRGEHWCEREHENAREPFHQVCSSSDASKVRSCAGLRSSSPTSCDDTGSGAPGCSRLCNSSRSCGAEISLRSTVSTGAGAPDGVCHMLRATSPAPATMTSAAAILSHAGWLHTHGRAGARASSCNRATTAWAVRSTSSRSATRAPSRCASSCNLASWNVASSFISGTPLVS